MCDSNSTRNMFERNLEDMRAKAEAYRRLAGFAKELVQDFSIAARADEAAKSYEMGMYERAKWNARNVALECGHAEVAESVLYEMDIADQSTWPEELKEAIRCWRDLSYFRPIQETPV